MRRTNWIGVEAALTVSSYRSAVPKALDGGTDRRDGVWDAFAGSSTGPRTEGSPNGGPEVIKPVLPPDQPDVPAQDVNAVAAAERSTSAETAPTIWTYSGLKVEAIQFEGVEFGPSDTLPGELSQKVGSHWIPRRYARQRVDCMQQGCTGRSRFAASKWRCGDADL